MRKRTLFVIISIILFFGCKKEDSLIVDSQSIIFSNEGGTQTINITSNGEWTAAVSGEGFSVSPNSGKGNATVSVNAEPNAGYYEKQGRIVFSRGEVSSTVNLTQDARPIPIIEVDEVMTIPREGGTFEIGIRYNSEYTVEVAPNAKTWITYVQTKSLDSGILEFHISANDGFDTRTGTVVIKDMERYLTPITLTFVQEAKPTIQMDDSMTIPAGGGFFEVEVRYNTELSIEIEESAQAWISFIKTKSLIRGKLEFNISPNESYDKRVGVVTVYDIKGMADPISFTFIQEEHKVLILDCDEIVAPMDGGIINLEVSSNVDYYCSVLSGNDWVYEIPDTKGLSSSSITLMVDPLPDDLLKRETTITVSSRQNDNISQTLWVRQIESTPAIVFNDPEVECGCVKLWDRNEDGKLSEREASLVEAIHYFPNTNNITSFEELRFFKNLRYIGSSTFSYSSLQSIVFPDSLEEIGIGAFSGSPLAGELVLPSNLKTIGDFAFQGCARLTGYLTIPEGVERIGLYAFNHCGFSGDLIIPEGVKYIGSYAFVGNSFCSIFLPESLLEFNVYAFDGVNNAKVILKSTSPPVLAPCNNPDFLIYVPSGTAQVYQNTEGWKKISSYITEEGHQPSDFFYVSSDYSRDGEVVCLQRATKGRGINIIFLGDAFVDKDMEPGGFYESLMRRWMEQLFVYEPFKSLREWFNIYAVKVVSKNDVSGCSGGDSHFTKNFVDPFHNNIMEDIAEYARLVPNPYGQRLISVLFVNREKEQLNFPFYGGTQSLTRIDYLNRNILDSYAQMFTDIDMVPTELNHEIGHIFGLLADEYETGGAWDDAFMDQIDREYNTVGQHSNIDWRNDPSTVRWSRFLADPRYSNEGLGIYEGAYYLSTGIYRPSFNSMMRHNDSPYNAPSREAIYKQIMIMGIGEDWTYDYEEFVAADEPGRRQAAEAYAAHPPIIGPFKTEELHNKNDYFVTDVSLKCAP